MQVVEKQSASGEIAVKLADWYLEHNEWGRALQLLEKGIAKGSLSDPQYAQDLLARSYALIGRAHRPEQTEA